MEVKKHTVVRVEFGLWPTKKHYAGLVTDTEDYKDEQGWECQKVYVDFFEHPDLSNWYGIGHVSEIIGQLTE